MCSCASNTIIISTMLENIGVAFYFDIGVKFHALETRFNVHNEEEKERKKEEIRRDKRWSIVQE